MGSSKNITPNLTRDPDKELEQPKDLSIRKTTLTTIRKGMFDVLNEKEGTAFKFRSTDENFSIAGKTGTSQVRRITQRERDLDLKQSQIEYKNRDHALYIAFAPYKEPRYSISVLIEHGGSGSKAAAPLASKLIKKIIDRHDLREQTRKANMAIV